LGTAVLIMDVSGLVVENNRTMPYGEEWLPTVASANEQKFTSYQRDGESGLDYALARFFASALGTLRSPDKGPMVLHMPGTLNRYGYGLQDPINIIDPTGNFIERAGIGSATAGCPPGVDYETISTVFGDDLIKTRICLFPPPSAPNSYHPEPGGGGGGGGNPGSAQDKLTPNYSILTPCRQRAVEIMSGIRENFGAFADAVVSFSASNLPIVDGAELGQAYIRFKQGNGDTPVQVFLGASISIDHYVEVGGEPVLQQTTNVTVVDLTDSSFRFSVNAVDALIYPAEIEFSASDGSNGTLGFGIQVQARPNGLFSSVAAATGVLQSIENGVWTNFLRKVEGSCK
jgi:RHS repeat-associated protein